MFGSGILDVAIGLIFIYLLLSIICSAINELIEAWLKKRATDLERGLRELLNDPNGTGLVKRLYEHPLIYGLFKDNYNPNLIKKGHYPGKSKLPSYIPSRNFALALMDIVLPATPTTAAATSSGAAGATAPFLAHAAVGPLQTLRNAINKIGNPRVEQALMTLVDAAGDDVINARENIETWYNSTMERVGGWYKRRVQRTIFLLGIGVAIAVNADTITISTSLSYDQALRNSLVSAAQEYAKNQPQNLSDNPKERVKENLEEIRKFGLPVGWNKADPRTIPTTAVDWTMKVIGWLLTAIAISLGAPFWFDLLNKFMGARSTIKPRQKP
jgi:hypothetical protein